MDRSGYDNNQRSGAVVYDVDHRDVWTAVVIFNVECAGSGKMRLSGLKLGCRLGSEKSWSGPNSPPFCIMLVSHIRHLVEHEGVTDIDEAVRRGASERLVPILMTALPAGLGLVPLALSAGEPGSEIQSPMAIVILCGLLTSTALNMFIVPALYRHFGALAREQRPAGEPVTSRG